MFRSRAPIDANQHKGLVAQNANGLGGVLIPSAHSLTNSIPIDVAIVDGAGNQVTSFGGTGGTSSSFGSPFPSSGTAAGASDGTNMQPLLVDGSGYLEVNVKAGSGLSVVDEATFTAGTSNFVPNGGVFNDSVAALSSGEQGTQRLTANRAGHVNIRNASGTELATSSNPLQVSLANTGANATAVKVDGSGVTQPVSGTVTANAGTNLNTSLLALESGGNLATLAGGVSSSIYQANVKQINGVTPLMGNGVTGTGSQRVTIASDNTAFSVNATLSTETTKVIGTVNQGTSPWIINVASATGSGVPANAFYIGMGKSAGGLVGVLSVSGAGINSASNVGLMAVGSYINNGTTFDMLAAASSANGTTGTGVSASGIMGFDGTDYRRIITNANGNALVGTASAVVNVGQQTVSTTAVQISASSTVPTNGIIIRALSTNAASVFVGGSSVTTSTGFELVAGESMSFTANLNTLYIISVASTTDKICYNVE